MQFRIIDGIPFYVLAKEKVKEYNDAGQLQGEKDAVLLWATDLVKIPKDVSDGSEYRAYYNLELNTSWAESYIRNKVLPAWITTTPTIATNVIKTQVITDGYYLTAEDLVGEGSMPLETTYDEVYILSQPEFLGYELSTTEMAKAFDFVWVRSPWSEKWLRCLHSLMGTIYNSTVLATNSHGVRPVFWMEL